MMIDWVGTWIIIGAALFIGLAFCIVAVAFDKIVSKIKRIAGIHATTPDDSVDTVSK